LLNAITTTAISFTELQRARHDMGRSTLGRSWLLPSSWLGILLGRVWT
jgi:hypothetical protein